MADRKFRIPKLLIPGAVIAIIIVLCMGNRGAGDFYAMNIYPALSSALSLVASPFRFSLQAVLIVFFIALFVWIIIRSCRRKYGFANCILKEMTLIVWIFVWSYLGWCLNYSRSPITERVGSVGVAYDSTAFVAFLTDFTEELNASRVPDVTLNKEVMENNIREFYSSVPEVYGLCRPKRWQHPKRMPLSGLESAMGILGYIGPFFCESHLNTDLPAADIPYTFAHEYSHLLGVSSEAEANWWAFQCCRSSDIPEMRYSAYFGIVSAVLSNAARLLSEEDFNQWALTISPEVRKDLNDNINYWRSKRIPLLDDAQKRIYDIFLKSNNIPSGMKNYSEVIGLMMSLNNIGE